MNSIKSTHIRLALSLIAVVLISACAPSNRDCFKPEVFCVGLVTQVGRLKDNAFNESAWKGIKLAESDLGAKVAYIETTDFQDYDKNIATFADAGYDVIVTVGSAQNKATINAAAKYPGIDFIGVDQFQYPEKVSGFNLAGLIFPEDQAGFLAGALAAQMTQSGKVGAVTGPDTFPPSWRYGEGFKAGVAYMNSATEAIVIYHNDLGFGESIADPEWDATSANTLIDQSVDIVFGAEGAVSAAARRDVYAIGLETDQYFTMRESQSMLLSSAINLIEPGIFELIKAAKDGSFSGGNFSGQVGLAPYHDLDGHVPLNVKNKMSRLQKGVGDGSIQTNVPDVKP